MNDQWKQFVADAYDAFGDCAQLHLCVAFSVSSKRKTPW